MDSRGPNPWGHPVALTPETMFLAALIAVLIGASLGVLGGGGSILTVPLLVHLLGVAEKPAIATSLLVVGVTAAIAAVPHARAGHVQWRTAGLFGSIAMVGAFAGGLTARALPGPLLLVLFALLMLVTAAAMWRGAPRAPAEGEAKPPAMAHRVVVQGLAVGFVTGLVGAGGGFLVVPALVLLGGLPMRTAVGTSLVVITMNSAAGFLGHLSHVELDYALAAVITAGAVLGALGGSLFAARVPAAQLRRGFAVLVVVMGVFLLWQELRHFMPSSSNGTQASPAASAAAHGARSS